MAQKVEPVEVEGQPCPAVAKTPSWLYWHGRRPTPWRWRDKAFNNPGVPSRDGAAPQEDSSKATEPLRLPQGLYAGPAVDRSNSEEALKDSKSSWFVQPHQ